jgi:hypothetical protein
MKTTGRWGLSIAATMLTTLLAADAVLAQVVPAEQNGQSGQLNLAVTYDALQANFITAQNFWMEGGAVELGVPLYHSLGIAVRSEGLHSGASSTATEPLSLLTAVLGPRFTLEAHNQRYALFGEGLAGIADGFNSLFPVRSGPVSSANAGTISNAISLALDIGGGVDVRLNHHLAVRAIRVSYLRTQLPNTTSNTQNNLSCSAGIVFNFGK